MIPPVRESHVMFYKHRNEVYTARSSRNSVAFPRISLEGGLRGEGVLRTEGLASRLPELGTAAAHDLVLADQLGAEFTAVQGEVDVKVYSVEDTLGRIHAFEVSLQILARQVRGEGDDLLDT